MCIMCGRFVGNNAAGTIYVCPRNRCRVDTITLHLRTTRKGPTAWHCAHLPAPATTQLAFHDAPQPPDRRRGCQLFDDFHLHAIICALDLALPSVHSPSVEPFSAQVRI